MQIPLIDLLPITSSKSITTNLAKWIFRLVSSQSFLHLIFKNLKVLFLLWKLISTMLNRFLTYQMMNNKDLFSFSLKRTWRNVFPSFWLPLMRLLLATVKFFGKGALVTDTFFLISLKTKGIWISTWKITCLKSVLVTAATVSNWGVIAGHITQLCGRRIRQNSMFWAFSF